MWGTVVLRNGVSCNEMGTWCAVLGCNGLSWSEDVVWCGSSYDLMALYTKHKREREKQTRQKGQVALI